jgi:hypothetical protein
MRATFVACLVLSPVLLAQDPPPKVVSGHMGLDIKSQYFFRGLLQENQGLIVQPRIGLGYALYEGDGDGTVRSMDLKFGLWNSLHDGPTGGAGGIWYESNFYLGVDAHLGERLKAGVSYVVYDTPNGTASFSKGGAPVEEFVFTFDYDDRGMWFESIDSGLRPSLVLAFETDGQRDVAAGGHIGIYAGLGIAPSFVIGQLGEGDLTLTLPATLGLSLRDYYERAGGGNNDFFGYLDIGADLSAPLKFLPARMGPWEGEVGLHLLVLGDNQRARNNGDTSELILSAGFSTFF